MRRSRRGACSFPNTERAASGPVVSNPYLWWSTRPWIRPTRNPERSRVNGPSCRVKIIFAITRN